MTLAVRLADNVSPRCRIRLRLYRDSVTAATVDYGWRDSAPTARTLSLRYRCSLPPGDYAMRLFARDGAGNTTYVRGLLKVR